MKSQKERNKALELYISNVPIYRIAKQMKLDKKTVYSWKNKWNWDKLKEEEINKQVKNSTELVIKEQLEVTGLAQKELLKRLKEKYPDIKMNDLISLVKHRLEIIRPKQVTTNLNISKTENKLIQVNIPEEVKKLINEEKEVQNEFKTKDNIKRTVPHG